MTAPTRASGAPPWAVRLDLAIGLLCLSESERAALEAAIREAVLAAQAAQRAADAGVCEAAKARAVEQITCEDCEHPGTTDAEGLCMGCRSLHADFEAEGRPCDCVRQALAAPPGAGGTGAAT